jgi:hypothetical protein
MELLSLNAFCAEVARGSRFPSDPGVDAKKELDPLSLFAATAWVEHEFELTLDHHDVFDAITLESVFRAYAIATISRRLPQ